MTNHFTRRGFMPSTAVAAAVTQFSSSIARNGGQPISADSASAPGDEQKQYAMHAFGAVFVQVHVDADLGTVTVPRVVGVYGVGEIGIVGLAAALAKAAYHATGKCIRNLPITPDKLV